MQCTICTLHWTNRPTIGITLCIREPRNSLRYNYFDDNIHDMMNENARGLFLCDSRVDLTYIDWSEKTLSCRMTTSSTPIDLQKTCFSTATIYINGPVLCHL